MLQYLEHDSSLENVRVFGKERYITNKECFFFFSGSYQFWGNFVQVEEYENVIMGAW